jgi:hypothetical protein
MLLATPFGVYECMSSERTIQQEAAASKPLEAGASVEMPLLPPCAWSCEVRLIELESGEAEL